MSGLDWTVIALGATGGFAALLAVAAAASRPRRRRKSHHARIAAGSRSQLQERRIEVIAIDDSTDASNQPIET